MRMLRQISIFMKTSSKVNRYAASTICSIHHRFFSSKLPNEKSFHDPNHSYRLLFKASWKNPTAGLAFFKGARRCSKNEMWWMIASQGNNSYRCITTIFVYPDHHYNYI